MRGRKPKVYVASTGEISTKTQIPALVWAVAERVGRAVDAPEPAAALGLKLLLKQVGYLFGDGDASAFGDVWVAALAEHRGTQKAPQIDITKLHRSTKLKSGFVGIYASGKGFTAHARASSDLWSTIVLGTYSDANTAAFQRWRHYKQHNLPYGELEEEMDRLRKDPMFSAYNDEQLIYEIERHCEVTGQTNAVFGPHTTTMRPVKADRAVVLMPFSRPPAASARAFGFDVLPEEFK